MHSYAKVKETWNKDFHNAIVEDLSIHQKCLALILLIPHHSLVLQNIEPGINSVMHWVIPSRLVNQARCMVCKKNEYYKLLCTNP